jgi:phosphopantothenoylcysteine decarboxylase / phosphopantothenate---cysteine ligase
MANPSGKSVLLIIGGGIAAYKSLELIRLLKKEGIGSRTIMTKAAEEFVTPLSVASLTEMKVHTELFNLTDESEMGHIELSRAADLVVVAPATADLLAKMAAGLANDLASTALLATDKKVLAAPAMNVRMWLHAATQRNVAQLQNDGVLFVGPTDGEMACGEFGPGRMADPVDIVAAIKAALSNGPGLLAGRRVLVTAGPTREAIDPVRYISNYSSGKQGYAIAVAAAAMGADVTLISGPVSLAPPASVRIVNVTSAQEMLAAVEKSLPSDMAIFTAAVADWRVDGESNQKIKKSKSGIPKLTFVENPDILKTVSHMKKMRPAIVVGFAAETENLEASARTKLKGKGCDFIVANDVSRESGVFGGESNSVLLVSKDSVESWGPMPKHAVADKLLRFLASVK